MNDNDKTSWNDIKIPDETAKVSPPGKPGRKGMSLPPVRFSPGKIALYAVLVILIILAAVLYSSVRGLKTDVVMMQEKVIDLQRTNQKLKDDLTDLNRKVEDMKAKRAALEAAPSAPKKEEPKQALKKPTPKPKKDPKVKPR